MNESEEIMDSIGRTLRNDRGVIAVIVALVLVVLLGIAALAIDVGYLMAGRNELQNAADAAALAAARQLGENYKTGGTVNVITTAENVGHENKTAGVDLAIADVSATLGMWDPSTTPRFTATSTDPFAVQVEVKRVTGTGTGAVSTFFGKALGRNTADISAIATASLSGICTSANSLPLGIGRSWFTNLHANNFCTQIALNDTHSSCAGWSNLSSAPYKQQDVQDLLEGKTAIPTLTAGDTINFGGGTTTPILNDLIALFNDKTKYASEKTFNADGSVKDWTTAVVVYEDSGTCSNPTGGYRILGFSTVTITGFVTTGNNKGPVGTIQCNLVEQGRGGCFFAGTFGDIPRLVQ
jgi:Flp pilus assembly protein TadG